VYPRVIKNEVDYERALHRVDELIDADPDTPEGDELELWTILIEAYERVSHPIVPPDPVEAIRFRMDQLGLRPVDLAPYLGGRSRVSEILNRKRTLSIAMIVALSRELGIPLESLLPTRETGSSGGSDNSEHDAGHQGAAEYAKARLRRARH
jgi:HTH-type transcriptional regulator / antitoxin HigA